jgi:hypothetical protein
MDTGTVIEHGTVARPVIRYRAETARLTKVLLVEDGALGTAAHPVTLFRAATVRRIRDQSMDLVMATTAKYFEEAALNWRPLLLRFGLTNDELKRTKMRDRLARERPPIPPRRGVH